MTMSRTRLPCNGASSNGKFAPGWVVAILSFAFLLRTTEVFAKGDALAVVDGEAITTDEIAKLIGASLSKLEEQIYTLKRRALDAVIADKLVTKEAAKRAMSVQALLEAETRDVEAVGEAEVEVAYRQQKAQIKTDEATAKELIRSNSRR